MTAQPMTAQLILTAEQLRPVQPSTHLPGLHVCKSADVGMFSMRPSRLRLTSPVTPQPERLEFTPDNIQWRWCGTRYATEADLHAAILAAWWTETHGNAAETAIVRHTGYPSLPCRVEVKGPNGSSHRCPECHAEGRDNFGDIHGDSLAVHHQSCRRCGHSVACDSRIDPCTLTAVRRRHITTHGPAMLVKAEVVQQKIEHGTAITETVGHMFVVAWELQEVTP